MYSLCSREGQIKRITYVQLGRTRRKVMPSSIVRELKERAVARGERASPSERRYTRISRRVAGKSWKANRVVSVWMLGEELEKPATVLRVASASQSDNPAGPFPADAEAS